MRVYLAGPITEDRGDRIDWRLETAEELGSEGIECLLPRAMNEYMRHYDIRLENAPTVLTVRDKIFTTECDMVLANFCDSTKASIGTCIELGWASQAGVPVVAAIPPDNVHEHPMVLSVITFRAYHLVEAEHTVMAVHGGRLD